MKQKKQISAAAFIKIWQSSESMAEVIKRTGKTAAFLSYKATRLRGRGVPLKRMKDNVKLDTAKLTELAERSGS